MSSPSRKKICVANESMKYNGGSKLQSYMLQASLTSKFNEYTHMGGEGKDGNGMVLKTAHPRLLNTSLLLDGKLLSRLPYM